MRLHDQVCNERIIENSRSTASKLNLFLNNDIVHINGIGYMLMFGKTIWWMNMVYETLFEKIRF